MDTQQILDKLQAFSFGRLQDAANVIRVLEKNGIDRSDFVAAVRQEVENRKERRKQGEAEQKKAEQQHAVWRKKAPDCPDCGAKLSIRPIRAKQAKQNRFGWRSHWHCMNCAWEQYSVEPVETEIKNYMEE